MVMGGTEAGPDRVVYLKTNVVCFFFWGGGGGGGGVC